MCEVGMRVRLPASARSGTGDNLPEALVGAVGTVIGHLGHKWAIVATEGLGGAWENVLVPEGQAQPVGPAIGKAHAVMVKPSGEAHVLNRERPRVRTRR